ncbi:MAG: Lrp/AsnC family transcriptional regulator [Proteobacteria bacterium]|nr:Lrp/AsnC family transcriptional regulator [Pseudomonadota bacterium]
MNDCSISLDALDWRLLTLLQADASRTNQALAEAAHVSPATALRRVRRLHEVGVIARTTALLAPAMVARGLTAISEVTLDRQGAEHLAAFEARAVAEPAVQQCWRVSPGPDFMLVSYTPDMPGHAALVQRLFTQDANVRNVKTFFAVARAKFGAAVPPPGATPSAPPPAP